VVTVTWVDNANNEQFFEIRRQQRLSNGGWGNEAIVGTVGANVTSFSQSPGAGRWRYSVRAVNAAGPSSWSAWTQINVN
ncbi:MAG: hypothetical protein ACO3IB_08905, partial [Phycisphaerales bacterium]